MQSAPQPDTSSTTAALPPPTLCPNCGTARDGTDEDSVRFLAHQHGTSSAFCLLCALEELERLPAALDPGLDILVSPVPDALPP